MDFSIGDCFSSFAELEQKVKSYQVANYVQLWKRDSKTIATAQKRMPNRYFNPDIKYSELWYSCVHGGRKHNSKSTGMRPNTSTFKIDCPFQLKLRSSDEGHSLIITKYINEHNHDISQPLYYLLPAQRRLEQPDKNKAAEMLKVSANRKLFRQDLSENTGKSITMKDVHNIAKCIKPRPLYSIHGERKQHTHRNLHPRHPHAAYLQPVSRSGSSRCHTQDQ